LGISLAGHKDRRLMTVFVCGLNPKGNAARDGRMKEGDIILVSLPIYVYLLLLFNFISREPNIKSGTILLL